MICITISILVEKLEFYKDFINSEDWVEEFIDKSWMETEEAEVALYEIKRDELGRPEAIICDETIVYTLEYYEEEDIERVPGAYFFKSEESKKAIEYIYNLIQEDKAYYDPFLTLQATELSLGTDLNTIEGVINQYCITNKVTTWDEAIKDYKLVVKKYLQDNFQ